MRLVPALALIVLYCPHCLYTAENGEAAALPSEAQRAVDAFERDLAKLVEAHQKEVGKRTKVLEDALAKAMDAATKKGDLDGALAIKAKLASLEQPTKEAGKATAADTITSNVVTEAQADALRGRLSTMSEEDWKQLPGVEVSVDVNSLITMTRVTVSAGERFLLVPCPTDRWASFSWEGNPAQANWAGLQANGGALVWSLDGQRANGSPDLVVTGEGKIGLYANFGGAGGRSGAMRVKILKIR